MAIFDQYRQDEYTLELLSLCQVTDVDYFFTQITKYYELLMEVNKTLNLTRITSPEEFWCKHLLDALTMIYEVPDLAKADKRCKVVDIGCGGGVPLIPLSLTFPHASFVGFESTRKKVFFIMEAIDHLELLNVAVFPQRAIEASHQEDFCEAFDVVTARAVARLEKLIPETKRFLKESGRMVFYKTPQQLDEEWETAARSAHSSNMKLTRGRELMLPGENGARQFAILSKRAVEAKRRSR